MPGRTKSPAYEVDFTYTRGGHGVGVALYRYKPWSLFGDSSHLSTMAFMRDGKQLLTAEGDPHAGLDSGYYADDWQSVKGLLYTDSPEDGTIEDMLNDEYPGLLEVVEHCLENGISHKLTLVTKQPISVPRRGSSNDGVRAASLVRKFLGVHGSDMAGNRVYLHQRKTEKWSNNFMPAYVATVVFESRPWTDEFIEWYANWSVQSLDLEPEIETLSSYEIGVLDPNPRRRNT